MLQTLLFILTVIKMTNCETLYPDAPTNFYIKVEESFTGEAGLCIRVFCFFTIPQSVSDPIRITWFKGDPQNPAVELPYFSTNIFYPHEKECNFLLNHLVQGKSDGEYRLKLEWGEGKVYIFPQTVNITVKTKLTQKPTISVPLLTVGEKAEISCKVPGDCTEPLADIVWTGIDGETSRRSHGVPNQEEHFSIMTFHPKPEHHNTKLTCTVTLQGSIRSESTVILKVRHSPTILNSSRCFVWGDELSCMCVSSGVPLPQIYWPILNGTTKYFSAVSTENIICISNISISGFRNVNTTIECVSENLIGMTKMEIQVHNHGEKPKVSWSFSTPWIFFTLSVVLNVIFASCLTVVLCFHRREKHTKPKDDDHVYMTARKRQESVYETIKMS
ncbi:sialic acid-binding Ig-like lectin 7 [Sinocyclocheilus anshuiensis]|uniref:sialic acid-binding Ig-like lectin 7 n=1 Tax=Sinocyclocheilus anshuiensis TaxID=1608454 RepID=UPI0007BA4404|nr:PREDICTED: sialic acid-binding Ig-like lectin 7 [Sinocyclocheilus anshuiensis]